MDDEKLISAVQMRPCIFDKADKNHFNRDLIAAAWQNIAKEVGGDADKCRKRWVTLRDYFFRKYRESKTTTSGQAASKKRKWHLYDYMLFLIPSCATGETCSNLPESDDDTQTSEAEQSHNSPLSLQLDDISSKTPKKTPRRKTRKSGTGTSEIDTEILKALREPEPQLDENELFFKSLLPSLKHLDAVQTMEYRLEVQRLTLTYLKSARSTTTAAGPTTAEFVTLQRPTIPASMYQHTQDSQNTTYYQAEEYYSRNAYSP